ncbi:substrate-binding domain-containing protein [Rhodomicrobium lacus]|uniref:substrate-binding domain-containing protein n=1 Tax=Rhodomicrobium lacus TaxID=2498452 RepID=UPI00315D8EAE
MVVGSHDPLLEWALRESRSGIATFLDGALDGLDRAAAGECVAAGLHIPEASGWNVASVADRFGKEPWVLIEWARRTRGLVMRTDLARKPRSLRDAKGLRLLCRQPEAGSELIFSQLLACEKLRPQDFNLVGMERSESDLVSAIAANPEISEVLRTSCVPCESRRPRRLRHIRLRDGPFQRKLSAGKVSLAAGGRAKQFSAISPDFRKGERIKSPSRRCSALRILFQK